MSAPPFKSGYCICWGSSRETDRRKDGWKGEQPKTAPAEVGIVIYAFLINPRFRNCYFSWRFQVSCNISTVVRVMHWWKMLWFHSWRD